MSSCECCHFRPVLERDVLRYYSRYDLLSPSRSQGRSAVMQLISCIPRSVVPLLATGPYSVFPNSPFLFVIGLPF